MPKLENWSVGVVMEPYKAPELCKTKLKGEVYGDSRFENGDRIHTSRLVKLNTTEGTAETGSGTKYELGNPDPQWLEWLEKNGYALYKYDR